jgi:hypothetical protein
VDQEEATEDLRKPHNMKLHYLYYYTCINIVTCSDTEDAVQIVNWFI